MAYIGRGLFSIVEIPHLGAYAYEIFYQFLPIAGFGCPPLMQNVYCAWVIMLILMVVEEVPGYLTRIGII